MNKDTLFVDMLADIPNFTMEELEYVKSRIDEELSYRSNDFFTEYERSYHD